MRDASQIWWAEYPIVRRLIDAVVRTQARKRLAVLDHLPLAQNQALTLSRLVRKAQQTRFGRDHDFRRIRDVADFRRLVPLCTPLDLWHTYWSTAYPNLKGVTWPTEVSVASNQGNGSRPIPVTADVAKSHSRAIETALAYIINARPQARLLDGQILWLTDPSHANFDDPARSCPALLQPYSRKVNDAGRQLDSDQCEQTLAQSASIPATCLVGEAGRLIRFLSSLKRFSKKDDLRDLWPDLTAVLFSQRSTGSDREILSELLATRYGDAPVLLLETAGRPEAPLAVEDPRFGHLRLLAHHGVYFEFVPVSEIHQTRPARHGLEAIEPGVAYAVAVTSPAGLWACLTGMTVSFERRDPPLLRVLSSAIHRQPLNRGDQVAFPLPIQPPHQRNGSSVHGKDHSAAELARRGRLPPGTLGG